MYKKVYKNLECYSKMKKRNVLLTSSLSILFLISFVSAQLYSSGGFSLSDLLSSIDPSTVILSIVFMISFAVIFFSTSKMFKDNRAISTIVSLGIALLIVYGINSANYTINVQNWFSGIGISSSSLYTIGSVLLIIFLIILFIKLKSTALIVIGIIAILLSFSGLVYSDTALIILGIFFIIAGLLFKRKKKKGYIFGKDIGGGGGNRSPQKDGSNKQGVDVNINIKHEQEKIKAEENEIKREQNLSKQASAINQKAAVKANYNAVQRNQQIKQEERKLIEKNKEEKQEQLQIESNLQSLIQTYNQLQVNYNRIQEQNPNDPELREVFDEMVNVRNEIKRLKGIK